MFNRLNLFDYEKDTDFIVMRYYYKCNGLYPYRS